MAAPHCLIGTSGWIYKHWKDLFYRGVKAKDWLPHYARHFPTVEVNNSFYRKPTPQAVARWPEPVPAGFLFAVKMWRGITHYRKLKDAADLLGKFMPIVQALPPPLPRAAAGAVARQFKRNVERLDQFLGDLKASMDPAGWRVAVEFRDPDWLHADVYRVLDRHGAALCLADLARCVITEPNDVPLVYVRRHGCNYAGNYTAEQIAADASRIRGVAGGGPGRVRLLQQRPVRVCRGEREAVDGRVGRAAGVAEVPAAAWQAPTATP